MTSNILQGLPGGITGELSGLHSVSMFFGICTASFLPAYVVRVKENSLFSV
jgi:hypothetical protein